MAKILGVCGYTWIYKAVEYIAVTKNTTFKYLSQEFT